VETHKNRFGIREFYTPDIQETRVREEAGTKAIIGNRNWEVDVASGQGGEKQ